MSEAMIAEKLKDLGLEESQIDSLASSLIWRIGRIGEDLKITVRVGLATNVKMFEDLPRLKNPSNEELEQALEERNIRVEWVGHRP